MQKYANDELINSLETIRMNGGGCAAIEDMLTKEYEAALKKAGFNLKSIWRTKDGRYKICTPIQVCRKNRVEVLKEAYVHYYGKGAIYTLEEVFNLAMADYRKLVDGGHRVENTYDHYFGAWKRFISKSDLPRMPISKIRRRDLLNFYADIIAPDANGERITRSTLRNVITTMNLCFGYAFDYDLIDSNIAVNIKTDKFICERAKGHDAYTPAEVEVLRETLGSIDSVYARIIRLDLCLVARIGELEALKWEDVDFDNRTARIHSQIVRRKEGGKDVFVWVPYTKTGRHSDNDMGKRTLKLNSKAIQVLEEQRAKNPDCEYVFASRAGPPLITNRIDEHLRGYCKKAGVRYLSTHSIRSTNITKLFDSNVSPAKIQMMAGHNDIRTTNGYCRSERCDGIDMEILEKVL